MLEELTDKAYNAEEMSYASIEQMVFDWSMEDDGLLVTFQGPPTAASGKAGLRCYLPTRRHLEVFESRMTSTSEAKRCLMIGGSSEEVKLNV